MDPKERILSAVTKEATPIYKIAEQAGVCTTTASKYLYILQAEGKVVLSSFGNMKLVRRNK
jgi:DNA-binding IclR family transcriptional regulator